MRPQDIRALTQKGSALGVLSERQGDGRRIRRDGAMSRRVPRFATLIKVEKRRGNRQELGEGCNRSNNLLPGRLVWSGVGGGCHFTTEIGKA